MTKIIKVFVDEKGVWSEECNATVTKKCFTFDGSFKTHRLLFSDLSKVVHSNGTTHPYVKGFCLESDKESFTETLKEEYIKHIDKCIEIHRNTLNYLNDSKTSFLLVHNEMIKGNTSEE